MIALLLLFQAVSGEAIYNKSCAVAFCHGPGGTAGRAPALTGRNYSEPVLQKIILEGIPSRGMPAFKKLSRPDLKALTEYLQKLDAAAPGAAAPAKPAPAKLPAELAAGRELFFDSARMPGCTACHSTGLRQLAGVDELLTLSTPNVKTARVEGEPPFPALVLESSQASMRVLDLSSALPVLRTVPRSGIQIESSSNWSHASAANRYTRGELETILRYLRGSL